MNEGVVLGGMVPFTTIDYPGKLAAVLFCQGCAWRCSYCHNPDLQPLPLTDAGRSWVSALAFLRSRQGLLEAVVFSGGEPLLQSGLLAAMAEVKELGFAIGLHTSGCSPARLRAVLPLCDWVGLDIKGPLTEYARITGSPVGGYAFAALDALLETSVDHEVRTTVDARQLSLGNLLDLAEALFERGARQWVLQACRDGQQVLPLPDAESLQLLRQRFPALICR